MSLTYFVRVQIYPISRILSLNYVCHSETPAILTDKRACIRKTLMNTKQGREFSAPQTHLRFMLGVGF